MKRFAWPLQRLFNVTAQREQALRMDVLALTQETAARRREIISRRSQLTAQLDELGSLEIGLRVQRQDTVLKYAGVQRRQIEILAVKLREFEQLREQKMTELMKARSRRKTLERLRGEALQRHLREQMRLEQKQFDESAHLRLGRRATSR